MAGLGCDELLIIGGFGDQGKRGDGCIVEIPKMRLKTVIGNTDENINFHVYDN